MSIFTILLSICIIILVILILYFVCKTERQVEKYEISASIDEDLIKDLMNAMFPPNSVIITMATDAPSVFNTYLSDMTWEQQDDGYILASGLDENSYEGYVSYYDITSLVVDTDSMSETIYENDRVQNVYLIPYGSVWFIVVSYYTYSDRLNDVYIWNSPKIFNITEAT